MKWLWWLLPHVLVVLLFVLLHLVPARLGPPAAREAAVRAAVDLEFGSGAVVGMDGSGVYVLTAFHVAEGRPRARLFPHTGEWLETEQVAVNVQGDMALLRVNTKPEGILRICEETTIPRNAMTVGFPNRIRTLSAHRIINIGPQFFRDGVWVTKLYRASGRTAPGSSGGPLLNDNGEVVGVCCGHKSNRMVCYFGSVTEIHKLCDDANMSWLYR